MWDDLEKCKQEIGWANVWHVMCVNMAIVFYPFRFEHAFSNHSNKVKPWVDARDVKWENQFGRPKMHTGHRNACECLQWPLLNHGTSGLNAIYAGLCMDYQEIWLVGLPLDNSGHFYDPPWLKTNFEKEVRDTPLGIKYWAWAAEKCFDGRVKSFSGRTRELLGSPK